MPPPEDATADRAEATRRPRFQFSLRTLLWFMTICALASAVLGWAGPKAGMAVAIGIPHMLFWGVPISWVAVNSVRLRKRSAPIGRATSAATFAALLCAVVLSGVALGFHILDLNRTKIGYDFVGLFGAVVFVEFFSLMGMYTLFVLAALPATIVASLLAFCAKRFKAWPRRPFRFGPKTPASLTGGATGFCLSIPIAAMTIVHFEELEARSLYVFAILLPSAMGFTVPPLLIAWADWLGPIETNSNSNENSPVETGG